MPGTHSGPFAFRCDFCKARPGKPCRDPRTGKTCKRHPARVAAFYRARGDDRGWEVSGGAFEMNRSKH